jgi:hypothetical protein
MYHPVLENSDVDDHEFVEIHNPGPSAVALGGWRLDGDVKLTFPAGASIGPRQHLVAAKNKEALLKIAAYGLRDADILGAYDGELDNGRGRVVLVDDRGAVADMVAYRDEMPWPLGADALGAAESWLQPAKRPLARHQYMGHSLERASFDVPATEVANWVPSPLDGATPARPNKAAGPPPAIVESFAAFPRRGEAELIRKDDEVVVRARFSALGRIAAVAVEWFVDDLAREDEPRTVTGMAPGPAGYEAMLPPRPDNGIVRFRILGDRGAGREPISPRPSDPFDWHAYFVSPVVDTRERLYQIFIAPASWTRMWTNTNASLVSGCTPNPLWDQHVPAVLVFAGRVYDVQTRYSGSRFHRRVGAGGGPERYMTKSFAFPYAPPSQPSPLLALGWHVKFPRYREFEGRDTIKLNKLLQSCPGVTATLSGRLYNMAGIPCSIPRFVRVHVNGGTYHYMMEHEGNVDTFERALRGDPAGIGDVYKVEGTDVELGPYFRGDARVLGPNAACPQWSPADRYSHVYSRKNNEWKGPGDVMKLIADLDTARRGGVPAMRAFIAERFDLEKLHAYVAIRKWAAGADDIHQNHFLYRRRDGKWLLAPWDVDREFGSWRPATASFYIGEEGNPSSLLPDWWNRLLDAYFKSYRAEYHRRLHDLDKTLLSPESIARHVDETMAAYNRMEAAQTPIGIPCDIDLWTERVKRFAVDRRAELARQIPPPR